ARDTHVRTYVLHSHGRKSDGGLIDQRERGEEAEWNEGYKAEGEGEDQGEGGSCGRVLRSAGLVAGNMDGPSLDAYNPMTTHYDRM
ncbi:hypothetical protein FRC11_000263, partial [Ceratobasidium sp. 423]